MKELERVMFGALIVLSVLIALVLVSGCTDTGVGQVGVPGATLIGNDESTVSGMDSETGKMETARIVVDVYGDKDLATTTEMRYRAISGQKMTDFGAITYNGIAFAFGVKNTGSVDIQIVGAKIKDSQNVQNYDYVSEADYPRGVKTIGPGETTGVYWTFPSEIDGDTRFVVEIKTLKNEKTNVAKAQVAAQPKTETEPTSQPTVTTTGPTPTQVGEAYYKAVLLGDTDNAMSYLSAYFSQTSVYEKETIKEIIGYTEFLQGQNIIKVELRDLESYGDEIYCDAVFIDRDSNEIHREKICLEYVDGEWKKTGLR